MSETSTTGRAGTENTFARTVVTSPEASPVAGTSSNILLNIAVFARPNARPHVCVTAQKITPSELEAFKKPPHVVHHQQLRSTEPRVTAQQIQSLKLQTSSAHCWDAQSQLGTSTESCSEKHAQW